MLNDSRRVAATLRANNRVFCGRLPSSPKLYFINFQKYLIYVFSAWGVRIENGIGKGALLQIPDGSLYIP